MNLKSEIAQKFRSKKGQVAILIDPEETHSLERLKEIVKKAEFAKVDYFFIGGSTVTRKDFQKTTSVLKDITSIPLIIFPGDYQQLSDKADALLYLSLLSGRNPEYLIGQHVRSAQEVLNLNIEVIPTAYILIDGGRPSSVASVSQTIPITPSNTSIALNTAIAGVLQGKKAVYFDAGSGAKNTVSPLIIEHVLEQLDTTIIVGGGIRSIEQIKEFKKAGAHIIVIGTKVEENIDFLLDIQYYKTHSL